MKKQDPQNPPKNPLKKNTDKNTSSAFKQTENINKEKTSKEHATQAFALKTTPLPATDDFSAKDSVLDAGDKKLFSYMQEQLTLMSYVQVLRFLYRFCRKMGKKPVKNILITPSLFASARPQEEVLSLSINSKGQFEIECNLFAIYGAFAVLPEAFTRRLVAYENAGYSEPKAFIDTLQSQLHHLYFKSQVIKSPTWQAIENGELEKLQQLSLSVFGITDDLRFFDNNLVSWLNYKHLFQNKVRNAVGLKTLLDTFFSDRGFNFHFNVGMAQPIQQQIAHSAETKLGEKNCKLGNYSYSGGRFQNTQLCISFDFHIEDIEQYYEFVYSDLIHVFVRLALIYTKVHYDCLFRFDTLLVDKNKQFLLTAQYQHENQLGVTSYLLSEQKDTTENNKDVGYTTLEGHQFLYHKIFPQKAAELLAGNLPPKKDLVHDTQSFT